jgi:hypothetical protein
MNNFREIIYSLKQVYGTPIDVYTESSPILNPETGKNDITRTKEHINKAIVLTSSLVHNSPFMQQLNRLTKHSGEFDLDTRNIIIDPHDITIDPKLLSYIDYNDKRYDVAAIDAIERKNKVYGWFLKIKEAKTSLLYKQVDQLLQDYIIFAELWIPYLDSPYPTEIFMNDQLELIDGFQPELMRLHEWEPLSIQI